MTDEPENGDGDPDARHRREHDARIVEALQVDPPRGIEMLLTAHGAAVLRNLTSGGRNRRGDLVTRVRDAIADGALRAAEGIATYDPARAGLRAWFRGVVVHELCGALRKERRRLAKHEATDLGDLLDQIALPDAPACDARFRREFDACVASLSPLERDILRADLAAGHSVPADELAEELGTTPETVTSLRYRRNKKLKAWLERYRGESS